MTDKEQQRIAELNVERINVVDPDGTVRLVIANKERLPGGIVDGKELPRQGMKTPGLLFYNDLGDECGGLIFGGKQENGQVSAGGGLLFDQFKQDQVIGITTREQNGRRTRGLEVWDRPDHSLTGTYEMAQAAQAITDRGEQEAAFKEMQEAGHFGYQRLFVGRNGKGEALVMLADSKGRPRIRLRVDEHDVPRMEFLDEAGNVTYSLPPA